MLRRSDDANRRRVRRDTSDVVSRDKIPNYPRMDFNLTSHARIETNAKLAGNDLYHFKAAGLVDLAGSNVEGVVARFLAVQFDFGVDVRGLDVADAVLRTPQSDLDSRNVLGTDLKILRNIVEFDRYFNCNHRNGVASHREPQCDSEAKGEQL